MKRLFLILTGVALIFATSCKVKNKVTEPALEFKHEDSGVTAFVDGGKVFLRVNTESYNDPDKNSAKPVKGLKGTCRGVYIGNEGNEFDVLICMLLEDGSLQVLSLFDILYENSFTASDKIRGLSGIVAFFTTEPEADPEANVGYASWHTFAVDKNGKEYMLIHYLNGAPSEAGKSSNTSAQRHPAEPEMVNVQGGTFTMGCTDEQESDCWDQETPAHSVTVGSFQIGKYEVTQAQWQAIMGNNPSYFKGDNRPVEQVSWEDVQEFIRRLNTATGKRYRLPTEAEWEYAARGGNRSKGYEYSGSDNLDEVAWFSGNLNEVTWYNDNSGEQTQPVGKKKANELGIYDMSGNVWGWCQDWYGAYSASSQQNPTGASTGSTRVVRGGSWSIHDFPCRVVHRNYYSPGLRRHALGFRVALP